MGKDRSVRASVFHIDKHTGRVTLVCPHCRIEKTLRLEQLQTQKKLFGVKCTCNRRFAGCLEFRTDYRKDVRFPGHFELKSSGESGCMTVENLSLSGLGFRTAEEHNLAPGILVTIRFQLDDQLFTPIKRQAEVVDIADLYVGAKFTNIEGLDKHLGYYLMA